MTMQRCKRCKQIRTLSRTGFGYDLCHECETALRDEADAIAPRRREIWREAEKNLDSDF